MVDISVLIGVFGTLFGIFATTTNLMWARDKNKSNKDSALVILTTKVEYIVQQIDKVENKVSLIEEKFDNTSVNVAKNTGDIKTLFKYVDEFRDKIKELEKKNGTTR